MLTYFQLNPSKENSPKLKSNFQYFLWSKCIRNSQSFYWDLNVFNRLSWINRRLAGEIWCFTTQETWLVYKEAFHKLGLKYKQMTNIEMKVISCMTVFPGKFKTLKSHSKVSSCKCRQWPIFRKTNMIFMKQQHHIQNFLLLKLKYKYFSIYKS